jgi:hypothetical protein
LNAGLSRSGTKAVAVLYSVFFLAISALDLARKLTDSRIRGFYLLSIRVCTISVLFEQIIIEDGKIYLEFYLLHM